MSSPGPAYAEELDPTPPAVVETTSGAPEPEPAAEPATDPAPTTEPEPAASSPTEPAEPTPSAEPVDAIESTPPVEPTAAPAETSEPTGSPSTDDDAGAPAPEAEPVVVPAAAPVAAAAEDEPGSISGRVTDAAGDPIEDVAVWAYHSSGWGSSGWTDASGDYTIAGLPEHDEYTVQFAPLSGSVYLSEYWDDKAGYEEADKVAVTAGEDTGDIDAVLTAGGSISGRLTDSEGTAVVGARVEAYRWTDWGWWDYQTSAHTNASGDYHLAGLPAGTYTLFVNSERIDGFAPQWWDDKPSQSQATTFEVELGVPQDGMDAVLARGGSVTGRVTDWANPVSDVWVAAYRLLDGGDGDEWTQVASGYTDGDGDYSLAGLPAGTYTLEFASWGTGYLYAWWNDKPSQDQADRFEVGPGDLREGMNAVLESGGSITGRVTDGANPVEDVWVAAYRLLDCGDEDAWTQEASGYTDGDGDYSLVGLPAGTYTLQFLPSGTGHLGEWWNDKPWQHQADRFEVGKTGVIGGRDAVLARGGSISGTVTNSGDDPIHNVQVTVYNRDGEWLAWGSTNAAGEYTISGLPAGHDYTLVFTPPPGSDYVTEYWNNKTSWDSADRDISVIAGETTAGRNAVLEFGSTLTGRVVNAVGGGIPSITVSLIPEGQDWASDGVDVEPDGTFVFDSLPAGRYTLGFWDRSWPQEYRDQWWQGATSFEGADYFDLAGGVLHDLADIELLPVLQPTSLSGQVFGADENPLEDVRVYLYEPWAEDESDWSYSRSTGGDGRYTFSDLEPGNYKLRFRADDDEHRDQWYQGRSSFATADPLPVVEGSNPVADVHLKKGARIQGQITYGGSGALSGQPLVDGEVRLYSWADPEGDDELASYWTGDDGTYSFTRLAPGEYYLEVGYGALTHKTAKIEVSEGAVVTRNVAVSPGASLSGSIKRNGAAVPNVLVHAWNKAGQAVSSTRTNAAGEYAIGGLAASSYTVSVNGHELGVPDRYLGGVTTLRAAMWLKLTAGEARPDVDLELAGGGVVQGTVTGKNGAGVEDAQVELIGKNGIVRTSVYTDDSGHYTITGIPAGTYALRVATAATYLGQWWNGSAFGSYYDDEDYYSSSGDIYFEVSDGETATRNVALTSYGTLSGTVHFTNATAFAGLTVDLTAYRRSGSGLAWVKDASVHWNGSASDFQISGLTPGEYLVRAYVYGWDDHDNYQTWTHWYDNALTFAEATAITVNADSVATRAMTFDLSNVPTGGISGTLVAPGVDWEDVEVTLESDDGEVYRWVPVDGTGAFAMSGLPAGTYRLRVNPPSGYARSYYSDALDYGAASLVTVGTSTVALGTWPLIAATGSVTGKIRDSNGTQLTRWGDIELYRVDADGEEWFAEWEEFDDGAYAFTSGLVVGEKYRLRVWVSGYGSMASEVFTAGQTNTIDISYPQGETGTGYASIRGTVSDADGTVSGIQAIAVSPETGDWADSFTSRADGSYALNRLRAGSYKVQFGSSQGYYGEQTYYAPAWYGGTSRATATTVTVVAGQVASGKDVFLTRAGRISGTVASRADGITTWLGGVPVSLYSAGGELLDTSEAGWRLPGGFGFAVPVGSYKICAQQSWAGTSTANCWSGGGAPVPLASAATITVAVGQDVDDIDLLFGGEPPVTPTLTAGTPSISGTAVVGGTLTAKAGSWNPDDVTFTYQWSRAGVAISGATSSSYRLVAADVGKKISVEVTGSLAGYASVSRTSAETAAVAPGVLTAATVSISGTASVGSTLTAVTGAWPPPPDSFTYQWKRAGSAIAGATGSSYTTVAADAGQAITVTVTGAKTGYTSASATSSAVTVAVPPPPSLSAPAAFAVSGVVKVNGVLTANPGTWGPAPVTLSYQWLRGGAVIAGATAQKYTVQAADVGKALSVRVTGTKAGYTTASRTSAATVKVPKALKLSGTPAPKIKGTVQVGKKLTVTTGTWKPKTVPLTVQWFRAGVAAPIATGTSYTLTAADSGKKITVRVTGAKVGYASVTKSVTSKKVAAGTLTAPVPKISGKTKVGSTLTVKAGTWKPAPVTVTYQWFRQGKKIKGATGSSYRLTASDKGKVITVKTIGSKAGFKTVIKTSKKTKKVA